MSDAVKRSLKVWLAAIALIVAAVSIWAVPVIFRSFAAVHQRDVTRELAEWKLQYSNITSDEDASRTADVLGYVQTYYVPSDGYRSDSTTEAMLEAQRSETVDALVAALKTYSKRDFGKDASAWKKAIEQRP